MTADTDQPTLAVLNTGDARIALWKAICDITIGNKTDDKLIVAKLAEQGVYLARTNSEPRPADEPWPGYTADQDKRRVVTLAKLGLMLSVMAGGEAGEVVGYDAADLYAEVLMALAIEDADDPDIALEVARDDPEAHTLAQFLTRPAGDLREAAQRVVDDYPAAAGACASIEGGDGKPGWGSIRRLAEALATHSPAPMAGEGWIVGNNVGQWRTFDSFGWAWTNRRDLAVRYARREDAELVHGDDEDSWRVERYPAAAHPSTQGV